MFAYWTLFFFILGALVRRGLGTHYYLFGIRISRFWKLLCLVLFAMAMYWIKGVFPKDWVSAFCMVWAIGWLVRFNSHTHGDYFDLESTKPDEDRSWWVSKVLKAIFGVGGYYHFAGNFIGLMLGYLVPAILASLTMTHHWFWIAGFTAPLVYSVCCFCLKSIGSQTEYAEYLHGALMLSLFFVNV